MARPSAVHVAAWKRVLVSAAFAGLLVFVWTHRHPAVAIDPEHAPATAPTPPTAAGGDGAESSGIAFTEVAREVGLVFDHSAPKLDAQLEHLMAEVASMGAAVSVTDVDNDGWVDVYASNSAIGSHNALFHNERGTFRDVAESAGLADVNRPDTGVSMGSIWGDVDGDGDEDVYVYKWGYAELHRNDTNAAADDGGGAGTGTSSADGGTRAHTAPRFSDVTQASGVRRWINANTACWLDYDRDGFLDLFTSGYFADDVDLWKLTSTRIRQNSFEFATNGGHKRLFHNSGATARDATAAGGGALRFEERTELLGQTLTRWTLGSAAADFDADGWIDLYVANDYGPEEYFRNIGGARFEQQPNVGLSESSKSGMCVALGDFQNDGALDAYVTNISKRGYLFQGNNLRENKLAQSGRFDNQADTLGGQLADCGWAWGAQFGDFDRDGWPDLFVANGFISASKERDYWYQMGKVAMGAGDIFEDAKAWPPIEDRSLSGYERSSVLRNLRGKAWLDVAEKAGVRDLFDGRGVAVADLWNRGALDVLVANQRGPLLAYKNTGGAGQGWVGVRLVGRAPNTSAIGAHVTLHFGARVQRKVVDGGSGFCSQNDRRLLWGIGALGAAADSTTNATNSTSDALSADIAWPSGHAQARVALRANAWNEIREP